MATFRSRCVCDTRRAPDTPVVSELSPALVAPWVVASVAVVTGVARVATRTSETSGAALPASRSAPRAAEPAVEGAVVRPLPTEPRPVPSTPPAAPPSPPPAAPAVTPPAAARRPPGKREIKRQETRARIVDAATELFAERGFDAVSVMEIARRAGVVEKTVFNHFPVKEGLVFDADPPMRGALLETVRRRPAGESVSAAAGTFVVSAVSLLGTPSAAEGVARMARIIRGSRTLQVREREIIDELTGALAELIAEETDARSGQLEPWLAAHAVLGLYAGLLELARDRVLAGVSGEPLAAELRRRGRRGLSLLQFGLAGYAKRR
jgi:AcrR family transcriptional regulator